MDTTNIQKWHRELWLLVVLHYQLVNTASWVNKRDYFRSLSTIYRRFSAWTATWFARMFGEIRVRFHRDQCSKLIWKTRLRFNTKVARIHKFIINLYFSSGWDLNVIIWGFQWVWSNWNPFSDPVHQTRPGNFSSGWVTASLRTATHFRSSLLSLREITSANPSGNSISMT